MHSPFSAIKDNISSSVGLVSKYQPNLVTDDLIKEIYHKIDDNNLQIMLYGSYNAGKSTLINTLLAQELATVNDIPTTDKVDKYNWQSYQLLDTPGVNAPIDHEETTIEQIKRTSVMLFVIREGDQDAKDV